MSDQSKPKAFLLMIEEQYTAFLHSIIPCFQFVEVQAVEAGEGKDFVLLANPKPKPPQIETKEIEQPAIEASVEEVKIDGN